MQCAFKAVQGSLSDLPFPKRIERNELIGDHDQPEHKLITHFRTFMPQTVVALQAHLGQPPSNSSKCSQISGNRRSFCPRALLIERIRSVGERAHHEHINASPTGDSPLANAMRAPATPAGLVRANPAPCANPSPVIHVGSIYSTRSPL